MKQIIACTLVCLALSVLLMSAQVGQATELVWTPINPSFGGSALNGSWLLSQANAQNKFLDRVAPGSTSTVADSFEDRVTSLLLSRTATTIVDEALGEDPTPDRNEVTVPGGPTIAWDINSTADQLIVLITDAGGGTTELIYDLY